MAAVDFITALGRLLRDGAMRDAFAANPHALTAQLNLRESDCSALARLIPADLEFQARVLLRKRLDIVHRILPETCRLLDVEVWPVFHAYARSSWPANGQSAAHDAYGFCRHLQQHQPNALCVAELNRLHFALSRRRLALHLITRNKSKPALQILLRLGRWRWREMTLFFGL